MPSPDGEGRATPISGFWIQNIPTPGFPTPKGMTTPCSFPRRLHSPQSARPRPSPSLACRVALMDLTAEKHYKNITVLSPTPFSSHRKYPHSKRGSRKPIRPTSNAHIIIELFLPTPKIRKKWSSRRHPRPDCTWSGVQFPAVPRWETTQFAPLNSFSPHSYANFPHQCTIFQQSPAGQLGPIGSLPGAF